MNTPEAPFCVARPIAFFFPASFLNRANTTRLTRGFTADALYPWATASPIQATCSLQKWYIIWHTALRFQLVRFCRTIHLAISGVGTQLLCN